MYASPVDTEARGVMARGKRDAGAGWRQAKVGKMGEAIIVSTIKIKEEKGCLFQSL